MNTSNLVALLACLSTVPACAVSTGSPASGDPATSGAATQSAPSGDWSCLANPPAGTAAQPQDKTTTTTPPAIGNSLNVHLRAAYTFEDVGNVQITACDAFDDGCATPLATAQADEMGSATLTATGGMAGLGYLKISGPSMVDNYVFFAGRSPTYGESGYDLTVYTQASLEITAHALGGIPLDPQRGIVRVDAQDCAGYPARGVALVLGAEQPITATRYFVGDGAALSADANVTDASGVALAFGVPPGAVGVAAKLDGQPAGGAMAYAHAGALTSVVVGP